MNRNLPPQLDWDQPQDIVCISSIDWDFLWLVHQELMSTWAKQGHRVLFIENTGIRSVHLGDLPRLKKRLLNWLRSIRGFRQESPNLYVYSPLVLPFPYSRLAQKINRLLILWDLRKWMKTLHFTPSITWTFLPTPLALELIRGMDPQLQIYYCTDNFAASSPAARKIRHAEIKMFKSSDLVFVTSDELFQYASRHNSNVFYFPSAVDFPLFEQARNSNAPAPEEIQQIPSPRIGYIGGVHRWVDMDLLRSVAQTHPECQFLFVGPIQTDISKLTGLRNIHLLGPKPHRQLPDYIRFFDVCLIPYSISEYTDNVYPTKLNEYLAMGKPVISTPLKEVLLFNQRHGNLVEIAGNAETFGEKIRQVLADKEKKQTEQRIAVAQQNSWDVRSKEMASLIQRKLVEKSMSQELAWRESFLKSYRQARRKLLTILIVSGITLGLLFYSPLPWYIASPLLQADSPRQADAIVVFAGGAGESGKSGQGYEERVQRAVELYQGSFAHQIIFSSGYVHLFHETAVMKALAVSLGIPGDHILLETESKSTHENVVNVSRLLNQNGWRSILLVSSPYHMRRASGVFARTAPSIQVIKTPVEDSPFYFRKQIGMTIGQFHGILHEYAAIIYYWFKGWI